MLFLWISALAFWVVLILGVAWLTDWARHT
jgi:hypothetical protein